MTGTNITPELAAQFDSVREALPGSQVSWLSTSREAAWKAFVEQGFPTKRLESWKYTDVKALTKRPVVPMLDAAPEGVSAEALSAHIYDDACVARLAFVDGVFNSELSDLAALPEGVELQSLAAVLEQDADAVSELWQKDETGSSLTSLNSALAADGYVLDIASGVVLDKPLQLMFVGTEAGSQSAGHVRNLIRLAEGASATLIENHVGADEAAYWHHAETLITLAPTAELNRFQTVLESDSAFHVGRTVARQDSSSKLAQHVIQLGGKLIRNDCEVELLGSHAQCDLDGLYLCGKRQHVDNHITIRHMVPQAHSRTHFKGAVGGGARAVFNGAIYVERDAQKTVAHLTNNNILLSDKAEIDTKPELEIYADDVECSHGATVGQLEEESLHYLRSRGIDTALAEDILLFAFCSEIVSRIEQPTIRQALLERVLSKLPNGERLHEVLG